MTSLICCELTVDCMESAEECAEQRDCMINISHVAHLSNGMHGELGIANVHSSDASLSSEHGTDGGAAEAIVAHYELLQGDVGEAAELEENGGGLGCGCVALVGVGLDDWAVTETGSVKFLVLARVVGMHTVGHVC